MKVKELLQILNNFVDDNPSAMEYEINMNNEGGDTEKEIQIVDVLIFPMHQHVTLYDY